MDAMLEDLSMRIHSEYVSYEQELQLSGLRYIESYPKRRKPIYH